MQVKIEKSWQEVLQVEFDKPYFESLVSFVKQEYASNTIFPPAGQIFNAFNTCPFNNVKVVILGQDPYHGPGQAHGLCFSVNDGIQFPPSLQNIFKEITSDLGIPAPKTGNLTRWAEQGVLLLNATLTVRASQAGSHQGRGWEEFTDRIIAELNKKQTPIVFLLWGKPAEKKAQIITNPIHKKLITVHPSPLSAYRGFFGCKHFSKTNEILTNSGQSPIEW